MVWTLKAKYKWSFSRLKWRKIGGADGITSAKNRKNIFSSKQTTNRVAPNIFKGFEVRKKVGLMFWRPKETMKAKCYVFIGYKQRNKVNLVYSECKLQQYTYGWCTFYVKCQKTVERTYLEPSKKRTTYRWCF